MGGPHRLQVYRIRKLIVCCPWVTRNCGSVPIKDYIDGMAACLAAFDCRKTWPAPRSSLFCGTRMATCGTGQHEVFCESTPRVFHSPMKATSEAEASTPSLRIAKGISGPE